MATKESVDDFCGRICQMVNDGHLLLSIGMGVRTGLWEAMAKWDQPKTSAEIADATKLKERYVREWLGAMVTGNIIQLTTDSDTEKFLLPSHRRRALTRAGETDSSAFYSLSVPALAEVFPKIEKCCQVDGPQGVSYSDYSELFWSSIEGMSEDKYNKHLLADIIPAVTGMTDALNGGASVLEIGCGPGVVSLLIAAAFPNCSILATDYSEAALDILRSKAAKHNLKNITVAEQDAANLPADYTGKYDYVLAHDMVHDTAKPANVLSECYRALKADGTFVMTDDYIHSKLAENVGNPFAPMVYNFSLMNCMPVSLHYDGAGLGAVWGVEKATEMIKEAGFNSIQLVQMPEGGLVALFISQK